MPLERSCNRPSALTRAAETQMRLCGLTAVQWAPLMVIARGGEATAAHLEREQSTHVDRLRTLADSFTVIDQQIQVLMPAGAK